MKIISLLAFVSTLCMVLRLPVFELTWAVFLGAPVVAFLMGQFLSPSATLSVACLAAILGVIAIATWPGRSKRGIALAPEAMYVSLAGAFFILLSAYQWPDFISMGERLRDYALLSSVVSSPVVPREPWLAGTALNYYLYWYRFGAFYGGIVGMPVWELYHAVQALTGALYLGATFQLLRVYGRASFLASLGGAMLLSFGSNIAGAVQFFTHDTNWWGPSRVIPGAINEFPAWSLLLGDLHPHYLNIGLVPFCVLLVLRFAGKPLLQAIIAIIGLLWVYSANAWEIPATLILVLVGAAVALKNHAPRVVWAELCQDMRQRRGTVGLLVFIVFAPTLYLSARNIVPAEAPLRFVGGEVVASPLGAFLLHWGVPLGLASLSLISLVWKMSRNSILALGFIVVLLSGHPLPLLSFLCGLCVWFVWTHKGPLSPPTFLALVLLLAGLLIVIVPELVFFDDPYGGENERMNTVFKFYSAAWWPLHCGALLLAFEALRRVSRPLGTGFAVVGSLGLVVLLGFFYQTYSIRQTPLPRTAEGLTSLEAQFPGSRQIVTTLRSLPRAVTLEAEGGAYDYTSHIATLGGMDSYLGWANHVNLLSRNYAEVSRREAGIRRFYGNYNCLMRRAFLVKEKIHYIVVGPLERQRYAGLAQASDFSCFKLVDKAGEYSLYE